jgi:two-component sensor histidine kinase
MEDEPTRLAAALQQQKETLLREMHHRVKNSLHVVSSLLQLQSGAVQDPLAAAQFRACQQRVRVIALVHEKLGHALHPGEIDFAECLRALVPPLIRSNPRENIVEAKLELETCVLNLDLAVALALIANELVCNSLQHAFGSQLRGSLTVRLAVLPGGRLSLVVADDGCGLPEGFDPGAASSVGLRLVRALVGQIDGTLGISSDGGARCEICFRRPPEPIIPDGT